LRAAADPAPPPPLPQPRTQNAGRKPLLAAQRQDDVGKKTLVLDLDETLVHSSFQDVAVPHFTVPVEIENEIHEINVIRRPGLDHFMRSVGEKYEVVVFTASLAKYANPVLDTIDRYGVVLDRLFRESCVYDRGNYIKDLSMLGRDLKDVIIIDNSSISYMYQPENAIPCSNFIDDPNDQDLFELLPLLDALANVSDVTQALSMRRK